MRSRFLLPLALAVGFASAAAAVDTGGSTASANADAPHLATVRALIDGGNFAGAVAALEPIVAERPEDADALNLMGYSLRKSGDTSGALAFYERALAADPDHLGAHEYMGELFVETGEREKAEAELAALERLCGQTCEEYQDLAEALAR